MDKPALLSQIQLIHPTEQLEYIQMLAKAELNRQIEESINGMLNKKPVEQLLNIINYKEDSNAIKERVGQEDNQQEHSYGSKGGEASEAICGDSLQRGRKVKQGSKIA